MSIEYLKKYKKWLLPLLLLLVCFVLFFYKLGAYNLIDVDETRYVSMSKDMLKTGDFLTLKLNNEFFFEKPPLYFWLEALSLKLFGFNEAAARIPMGIFATIACLFTYFFGAKIVSKKFGFLSSLILITSFEFLLLSKIAILDLILSVNIMLSLGFGFYTFFAEQKNKKYFWWLMYLFSGFAVMAKGIPGVAIPIGTMFFTCLFAGKIKEFFAPVNLLVGGVIFFIITLPWHIAMIKMHGGLFYHEYVVKHHLARFIDSSEGLGRKQPFDFYIWVFLGGFFPWITSFIAGIINSYFVERQKIKDFIASKQKISFKDFFNNRQNTEKLVCLSVVAFLFTFLFFSVSSTKLPTYILPAIFPAALIAGYFWTKFIDKNTYEPAIKIAMIINSSIFIIAGLAAIIVPWFLKADLKSGLLPMAPWVMLLFLVVGICILVCYFKKKKLALFLVHVFLIMGIAVVSVEGIFNFVLAQGEADLIRFAKLAKADNAKLASFDFGRRYSLIYYYDNWVDFEDEGNYDWLNNYFNKNEKPYVVVKNKNFADRDSKFKFKYIQQGKRYSLITKNK